MRLANILTAVLVLPMAFATAARATPRDPSPQVVLWTNRGEDVYQRGDPMTVFVRSDVDAYLTVLRVDADGMVRILFPQSPFDDAFIPGGVDQVVPGAAQRAYTVRVDEYPGEGFLFALVTLDPIAFAPYSRGRDWDPAALGLPPRVTDDPYVFFSTLLAALVPEDYSGYGYAVTPYYVEAQQGYPRFLCYQCHAYVPPEIWDPYAHSCIRVRVSEPLWWRYPGDRYGGAVVVPPSRGPVPRYVVEPRTTPPTASVPARTGRRTASAPSTGSRRPAPTVRTPAPSGRGEAGAGTATTRRAAPKAAPSRTSASRGSGTRAKPPTRTRSNR